jgi:hypothetical protein
LKTNQKKLTVQQDCGSNLTASTLPFFIAMEGRSQGEMSVCKEFSDENKIPTDLKIQFGSHSGYSVVNCEYIFLNYDA